MSRLKLLGLALMAVFAFSAFASASAFAKEASILTSTGEESNAVSFTAKAASTTTFSILEGFSTVNCGEVESEGAQELKTLLGAFHIKWTKCTTSLGGTCTGLSDSTAGMILALGKFHIVILSKSPLTLGILFLLEHVHFTCTKVGGFTTVLVLVKGEVLCGLTPLTLGTEKTIACKGKSGDAESTSYFNEAGTEVKIGSEALLSSENEGTFRMSAQEGTQEHVKTSESVELMD
jgi:hypothetical protein